MQQRHMKRIVGLYVAWLIAAVMLVSAARIEDVATT